MNGILINQLRLDFIEKKNNLHTGKVENNYDLINAIMYFES